jgi:hypothetical protein
MSWALSHNETPDAEATARWKGLVWLLARVTARQTDLPLIDQPPEVMSRALFTGTQEQADLLARRAAEFRLSDGFAQQLLGVLAATHSEFVVSRETSADVLFRRAQRLVLALDRFSAAVIHQEPGVAKNPALTQLLEDIRSRADFQVPRFAEHLRIFYATIKPSPR